MRGDPLTIAGNRALLCQGVAMLERLSDALYAEPRGSWAPVGAQYRHILEHYHSFFAGLADARVDYDARARDERIERERGAALEATRECLAALQALDAGPDRPPPARRPGGGRIARARGAALEAPRGCLAALEALDAGPDRPLAVQMDGGAGDDRPDWRPSSAGRELQFLCSHTVHHYALIKLLLDGSGVDLGAEFGVAPSTLAYQRAAR